MSSDLIPTVVALLLCDTVIIEEGTGKKSLIGVFDRFNFPEFPAQVQGFSFYARLTDVEGNYTFRIDVTDLEFDKVILSIDSSEALTPENVRYMDLVLTMPPVKFPRPGNYEFQLYANRVYIGREVVIVRKLEERGGEN